MSALANLRALARRWADFQVRSGEVLCMNARNLDIIFLDNQRRHFPLVNDKVKTKEILEAGGVGIPKTISVIESFFQLDRLAGVVEGNPEFVVKPANGSGGQGVFLAAAAALGGVTTASGRYVPMDGIRRHVAEILYGSFSGNLSDAALVEERLHPHPLFSGIWPVGLPDIRLIVHKGRPVMSMVRLPTKASGGTANLHQGGVGVGLDLETGRPMRAVCGGREIRNHPDSGFDLSSIAIPSWETIVATGLRAASLFPLGYLGVDLVLVDSGDVKVLELNARPGLQIQIATGTGLRKALA